MPRVRMAPDLWRQPTDTESRLLRAGVIPKAWTLQEARNWLWRHGLFMPHLCKEGTARAERLLKAYAAWADVLDPEDTPSRYRQVSFVPDGGKTGMKGHPFNRPDPHSLGLPSEMTDTEVARRSVRKLREITKAFRDAPIKARDMEAINQMPRPFRDTPRLYPCGRMWQKCPSVPDGQELPTPVAHFKARPVVKAKFLASICSRVLQWVACNPHAKPKDIAEAMGIPLRDVNHYISDLYAKGLLVRVQVYLVSPTLIGEDRLFTYKDRRKI